MTRPIDDDPHPELSDQDDPLLMVVVHLDNDSCAAALSMCQDILSSGYHISAKVRAAGPELKALVPERVRDSKYSWLTWGLPGQVVIDPSEIDFSRKFRVAVRGIVFHRTSDPLDLNNRPPRIPAIDKDTCQLSSINVIVKELHFYTSPAEVERLSSPPRWRTKRFFVKRTVVSNWGAEKLEGLDTKIEFREYPRSPIDRHNYIYPSLQQSLPGAFEIRQYDFYRTPDFDITLYYRGQDLDRLLRLLTLPSSDDGTVIGLELVTKSHDEFELARGEHVSPPFHGVIVTGVKGAVADWTINIVGSRFSTK
jgi:hypothetical protein